MHIGSAFLLPQNYRCQVTSTLYKADTSLRRTVAQVEDLVKILDDLGRSCQDLVKPWSCQDLNKILAWSWQDIIRSWTSWSLQDLDKIQARPCQDLGRISYPFLKSLIWKSWQDLDKILARLWTSWSLQGFDKIQARPWKDLDKIVNKLIFARSW